MTVRFRILSQALALALGGLLAGCINQPRMLPLSRQIPLDRRVVETPPGMVLVPIVKGLNCPEAMCVDDSNGNLLLSESGIDGSEPHIFGYRPDHTYFQIYPWNRTVSFYPTGFVIYGPVTAMACYHGKIYVAHRDREGMGVITAFGYDGSHTTIVAGLPCQGDYGIGDLVIHPRDGRIYFGIGTATNSGVVGLDNYDEGWLKRHPAVHDHMHGLGPDDEIVLRGYHFFTPNPWAGIGQPDSLVTGPFQKFGNSILSKIPPSNKPNGAICSVPLDGGEVRIEAIGLHHPRGLAFDPVYDWLYATNDGMELRGTRPVAEDPDALVKVLTGNVAWYGWPDFTTNFDPIDDARYAPPVSMISKSGYPDLQPLIDRDASHLLLPPSPKSLLYGLFPSLSGAAKMAFVPANSPMKDQQGNFVVALEGDRWPFDTSGVKLEARQGFKVVVVDHDSKQVSNFVHNTAGVPASMQAWHTFALERPCDVKFGPDGTMYILDFGRMDNNGAVPRYYRGTGVLFELVPQSSGRSATTRK